MSRAPLGAGLELDFERPAASAPHEPEPPELRGLVGADVLLSRGWRGQDADHRLHCVALPSLWLPGLERPILDAASALARRELALPRLEPGPIAEGPPFRQPWRGPDAVGLHLLGFAGDRPVICSHACLGSSCAPLDLALVGGASTAPQSPAWVRALEGAAAAPRTTALGAAALFVAVSAVILLRRPRPGRGAL